eukprot:5725817-Pyramimonas_sp.AAC.1
MDRISLAARGPQEYIQQKVNPLLENLVTQLLMAGREGNSGSTAAAQSTHSPKAVTACPGLDAVHTLSNIKPCFRTVAWLRNP